MVVYADETSSFSPISINNDRYSTTEILTNDISKISSWCNYWVAKLNSNKPCAIFIRFRSPAPFIMTVLSVVQGLSIIPHSNLLGLSLT